METIFKEAADGFTKSNLLIDDFPDLPIGIILCEPVRNEEDLISNLYITYLNPFAYLLLGNMSNIPDTRFLRDIPYLNPLFTTACTVMETGASLTIDIYEPEIECWLEISVYRKENRCVI